MPRITAKHLPPRRSAFTLIELLIVIVVVGVLVSFLLPAMADARRASRSVACLANLRTIGHALLDYTEGNRGILPFGFPIFDLRAGRVEPWKTLADRLDTSMPRLNTDNTVTSGQPWMCPGDATKESAGLGCGYAYVPGEFMRPWIPERRPEPSVTRIFRENPTMPLWIDRHANHATTNRQREQNEFADSGRNGFFIDASARAIK
jgi:prepilin-type N-terminal cleavage/methylation domain-containing protein